MSIACSDSSGSLIERSVGADQDLLGIALAIRTRASSELTDPAGRPLAELTGRIGNRRRLELAPPPPRPVRPGDDERRLSFRPRSRGGPPSRRSASRSRPSRPRRVATERSRGRSQADRCRTGWSSRPTARLSGIPATPGRFAFGLRVTDGEGRVMTVNATLVVAAEADDHHAEAEAGQGRSPLPCGDLEGRRSCARPSGQFAASFRRT